MRSTGITVEQAVATITAHYNNCGHTKGYVEELAQTLGLFQRYCGREGIIVLEHKAILAFMKERYDIQPDDGKRKSAVRRVMHLLLDVLDSGTIPLRYRTKRTIPPQFATQVDRFLDELRHSFRTEYTIGRYNQTLQILTTHFCAQGVQAATDLGLRHFTEFIKTSMCRHGKQHAAHELRTMRWFIRSLYGNGDIPEDFSDKLPEIRNATHSAHLPSAFTTEEIEQLLAGVDRGSPVGKRDYAILLIAAKLGLRSGDIRKLRFEHIDWENNAIRLVQNKTGEALALPLLPDIGWALIDYVKHGRPDSDSPEIFIRQVPPYVPMSYYDNMMMKYLQKAGIHYERAQHHGMHSLRHSLATTLLEQQTPIVVIQEVLGHTDPATTQRYLSVDVEQLRGCAMEVPDDAKN